MNINHYLKDFHLSIALRSVTNKTVSKATSVIPAVLSPRRIAWGDKRESGFLWFSWIPAFAGMTEIIYYLSIKETSGQLNMSNNDFYK